MPASLVLLAVHVESLDISPSAEPKLHMSYPQERGTQ